MFHQTFLSSNVKRCASIIDKHGIYKLPHELQNDLRMRSYVNQEITWELLKPIER